MEIQISDACRRSLDDLRSCQYELVGPEGEIILPRTWELTIQPGWTIAIVFTDAHQRTSVNEHHAQHHNIMERQGEWETQQEVKNRRWEAERQSERERWEEERRVERTRWEDERQRERDRWEDERRRELEQRLTETGNVNLVTALSCLVLISFTSTSRYLKRYAGYNYYGLSYSTAL